MDRSSEFNNMFFNQQTLDDFRKTGLIRHVRIYGENDGLVCTECRKLTQTEFSIDEVPQLPYIKCTSERGCRCHYMPVVSDELASKRIDELIDDVNL